jgi:uncharacterized membrane protein YqjE
MAYQTDRSFSEVLQDIVGNVQGIIRSELRLARTEVKEETTKAARAAGMLAAGAVLALYAVGFLFLTFAKALETAMDPWLANLIVAATIGLGAFIAIKLGRTRIKRVHATPEKTIETVKENVEWVKDQTK